MKIVTSLFTTILLIIGWFSTVTAEAQESKQKKVRIEVRNVQIGRPDTSTGPLPSPGDRFEYIPATGNYLVEFKGRDGTLRSGKVTPSTYIAPRVGVAYESVDSNFVRYRYTLTNGESAKQEIHWFAIAVSNSVQIEQIKRPIGWTLALRSRGPQIPRQNWFAENGRFLRPGEVVNEEFSFLANALPGRTDAVTFGPLPDWGPFSLDRDEFTPWVKARLESVLSIPNNYVKTPTIGPKIPIQGLTSQALLQQLHAEMISMGVDQNLIRAFGDATRRNDKSAAVSYRGAIEAMGNSEPQRDSLRSIAFNLEYLAKMP
jgi:hypothetical protein